jgi:ribosomal-protein-serine acetyltransferase
MNSEHTKTPQPEKFYSSDRLDFVYRHAEDAKLVFALIDRNREHLKPWMEWVDTTSSVKDSENYFEMARSEWEEGSQFDFTVFLKGTKTCIGSGGLHSISWPNRKAALGYWLGQEFTGQGYALEMVKVFEKIAKELGLHRLVIQCDRDNHYSSKVAIKSAYKFESLEIDTRFRNDQYVHGLQYVKLLNREVSGFITQDFPKGFGARFVSTEEFSPLTQSLALEESPASAHLLKKEHWPKLFNSQFENTDKLFLVLYYHDQVIGYSKGEKVDPTSFRMVSTVIAEPYRGLKLYSRIMDIISETCRKKGYLKIKSSHYLDNNLIIAKKIRFGFHITGIESNIITGQMVELTYYLSEKAKTVFHYRVGSQKPTEVLKKILDLG